MRRRNAPPESPRGQAFQSQAERLCSSYVPAYEFAPASRGRAGTGDFLERRASRKTQCRSSVRPSNMASAAALSFSAPLLIIAGAGTGKTSTLAHRVAHRVVRGADPGRILLLTFTTRAADEMARRVAHWRRSARAPAARPARGPIDPLVGHLPQRRRAAVARVRPTSGSSPRFQHPRSRGLRGPDESGASRSGLLQDKALSPKGTCLAIYSRRSNRSAAAPGAATAYPWCPGWAAAQALFLAYVQAKQAQKVLDYDDLLLYWARMVAEPELARRDRRAL